MSEDFHDLNETYHRELDCQLTNDEKLHKGKELVALMRKKATIEAEKKSAMAAFKQQIKEVDGEASTIAKHIDTGQEPREVLCIDTPDYDNKMVEKRRLDTNEVFGRRPMERVELQMALDMGKVHRLDIVPPARPAGESLEEVDQPDA